MNTVWQSLLWKEWHENRWKLASLTVILFAVTLCMSWGNQQWSSQTAIIVMVWYSFIVPIYVAAGVCASEASSGTLPFLQATPVDRRKWAIAKSTMGFFTVAMPLLLLIFFVVVYEANNPEWQAYYRKTTGGLTFFSNTLRHIFSAITALMSMFIWALAVGVNCRRELWVIACSLSVFLGTWFLFTAGVEYLNLNNGDTITRLTAALLPAGLMSLDYALPTLPVFLVAIIFHAGLLMWYLTRFGRSTRYAGHSPKAVVARDPTSVSIREPYKSKMSAILWMQMQEIAPLALVGIALAFLTAGFLALNPEIYVGSYVQKLGAALARTSGIVGFFFAILIGVGVFLRDLEPGLNTFWRSRPMHAGQWFWTKYLSAYAMLVAALALPTLWAWSLSSIPVLEDVLIVTGLLTAAYTTAVAVTVLVRHAIYGCLLSMGIVLLPFLMSFRAFDWDSGDNEVFYRVEGALQITLIVVTTLIAWLAVTRDWGWKR